MTSFGSRLAAVRTADGQAAMLKLAGGPEEQDGGALMEWWAGDGAAPVLARDGEALLMVRAPGPDTLAHLTRAGRDDKAARILCQVTACLHRPRPAAPPATLHPLAGWFAALPRAAGREGGLLAEAARAAERLLADPRDEAILHGDLHHDNVLDFGPAGWLAIDPKGLIGERGYDYANGFCNPWPEAAEAGRFESRLALTSRLSGIEAGRLSAWVLAYAGLSAAWTLNSGLPADGPWRALRMAAIALGRP